jgi:hypothetical protein
MLRDRYEPMNLFTYIPTLSLRMDPVLTQMDTLLDDDTLFQAVKTDLLKRYPPRSRGSPPGRENFHVGRAAYHDWSTPSASHTIP